MTKTKIFTVALMVAALVAGCTREENGRHLHLLAEGFANGNSKVLLDPSNPGNAANWVEGEKVKLNDGVYTVGITKEVGEDKYWGLMLNNSPIDPLAVDMEAYYPGESFGGNVVAVNGNEIELTRLAIEYTADGKQKMAFPMYATANANEEHLYFNHLSAGMQITLQATTAAVNGLASLKIVAQSNTATSNLGYPEDNPAATARWAVQGPTVPSGTIGNPDGLDAKYASEMNFDFVGGANIAANDDLVFCIPITLSHVDKLIVTGYDANGVELFHKNSGTTALNVDVVRNKMYAAPTISIN